MDIKRCPECIRPVCQRKLTLDGCKFRNDQPISKETIEKLSVNNYQMHNLYSG